MEKLIILCFCFLYTGSLGSAILPLNNHNDILHEYVAVIKQTNQIISYIGTHLSHLTRDYEHQISDSVSHANTFPILEALQNAIHNIEAETPQDHKNCIDSALRMTRITTEELKKGMDSCVSEARVVVSQTQGVLMNLDGKATNLRQQIRTGMQQCLNDEDNKKCLQDLLVVLKKDVNELKQEVEDVQNDVTTLTENGINGLNICLNNVQQDLTLKSRTILRSLNQCTQNRSKVAKSFDRSIADFIKDLIETINRIIDTITNLPSLIDQIPDKIQEIISHLNVAVIARQIQTEINNAIDDGGPSAEKCRPEAEERLNNMVESAEKTAKACLVTAHSQVDEIRNLISELSDKARTLLRNFNRDILKCNFENIWNPIGLYSCLTSLYTEYSVQVAALQTEVSESIATIAQQSDSIIKQLASCVNTVQLDTVRQGQQIIKDVEHCVLTIS